jgi:hypothetical protein
MTKSLIDPKIFVFILVAVLAATANSAIAGDTRYQRFSLKEGISVEAPSHWLVHADSEKKNFAAAGEGAARTAGIDYDTNQDKSRLIAISALPTPSGAKIRINLIRPLPFSSAELRSASTQDLKDVEAEFSAGMAKIMTAMGSKLLTVATPKIEMINGSPALLLEYRRSDLSGPSPWTVKQYRIPAGDKLIELTISYRESNISIWKPILEYVKQSLRF